MRKVSSARRVIDTLRMIIDLFGTKGNTVQPMAHGYTNRTVGDSTTVVKAYNGPQADARRERETTVLQALHGRFPVPPVLATDGHSLTLGFVAGTHAQDLIDAGHAADVLAACGTVLRRLHSLPFDVPLPDQLGRDNATGTLVHGDFGPNNMLLNPETFEVTALLDWEWAHIGDPIEDLAWCEWIIRMHHSAEVGKMAHFFTAYGQHPAWVTRRAAMIAQCRLLLDFVRAWDANSAGVAKWQEWLLITENWSE